MRTLRLLHEPLRVAGTALCTTASRSISRLLVWHEEGASQAAGQARERAPTGRRRTRRISQAAPNRRLDRTGHRGGRPSARRPSSAPCAASAPSPHRGRVSPAVEGPEASPAQSPDDRRRTGVQTAHVSETIVATAAASQSFTKRTQTCGPKFGGRMGWTPFLIAGLLRRGCALSTFALGKPSHFKL